uniref:Chromo domain-containing protein n=1 Tax=Ascaris lumbricoides TaxID=6252 RepID=A0A0M3IHG8_ASCLU
MSTKLNTNKEGFYDAERIVGYRYNVTFGRDEYLIKWDGYPDEECTWQPIEDLGIIRNGFPSDRVYFSLEYFIQQAIGFVFPVL